jgi:hypothetical protein
MSPNRSAGSQFVSDRRSGRATLLSSDRSADRCGCSEPAERFADKLHPRIAASMASMSIFFIVIIASKVSAYQNHY